MSDVDGGPGWAYMKVAVIRACRPDPNDSKMYMSEEELQNRAFPETKDGYGECIRVYADKDEQFCINMRAERNKGNVRKWFDPSNPRIFLRGGQGFFLRTGHHKVLENGKRFKVRPHFFLGPGEKLLVERDDDDEEDQKPTPEDLKVMIRALKLIRSGKLHIVIACTFWDHISTASDELISLLPDKWQSRRIIDVIVVNANPLIVTQNYSLVCQLTGRQYIVDFAIFNILGHPTIFIDVGHQRGDGFHDACKALNVKYARLTTTDVRRCYFDEMDKCKILGLNSEEGVFDEAPDAFPATNRLVLFSHSKNDDVFLCDQCKPAWNTKMEKCGNVPMTREYIEQMQQEYEDENITTIAAVNSVMTSLAAAEAAAGVPKAANAALESAKEAKAAIENKYLKGQLTFLSPQEKIRSKPWSSFLLTETVRKSNYTGVTISWSKNVELRDHLRRIAKAEDNPSTPSMMRDPPIFCYVKVCKLEAQPLYGCENKAMVSFVDDVLVGKYLPNGPLDKFNVPEAVTS